MSSFFVRLGYFIGSMLLIHSGYSSYEFNQFVKSTSSALQLPLDVKLEAILGLVVFIITSVFSIVTPAQYTIIGNKKVTNNIPENDSTLFKPIKMNKATILLEKIGTGPFDLIENRPAFIDILRKRHEFSEWAISQKSEKPE